MNADKSTYLTQDGIKKMREDISILKTKLREISERIEKAKELGDLSENAEYHEAKDNYAFTQGKIQELEHLLACAVVITKDGKSGLIAIGSKVKVRSDRGKESEYIIVGSNEADPLQGKISNESPLALAFLAHKKGERVEVKTPTATTGYLILDVN